MSLQHEDPGETDKALEARLQHLLRQPVSIQTRWVDPEAGESYELLSGVQWPEMTLEQAETALAAIQAAMEPAPERSLGALLAELWLTTAKRNTHDDDQQALAKIYIRELRSWPSDIAMAVLRRARREHRWFPPLADLWRQCSELARRRAWLLSSIEDHITDLQRTSFAGAARAVLQPMPGSRRARSNAVSWAPGAGNVDRLARHLGVDHREAFERVVAATPQKLAEFEDIVRGLKRDDQAAKTAADS